MKEPATEPEVATEPKAKTKCKISPLKLHENFFKEIKNEEKNINEQMFNEFFSCHSPSFLVKDLYEDNREKNDKIVKNINELFSNLENFINSKEIAENEDPTKIVNIVEKILDFNKQQKGKGCPLDLAHVAVVAKVSDLKHIKI